MTWNQFLNVNSWYSFVTILLPRFLMVYEWQYAPCRVICQFSRTQLPLNCGLGWGEHIALPRPSHLREDHCFSREWHTSAKCPSQNEVHEPQKRGWCGGFRHLTLPERGCTAVGTLGSPWRTHRCPACTAKSTIFKRSYNIDLRKKTVSSINKLEQRSPGFIYCVCLEKIELVQAHAVADYGISKKVPKKQLQ